MYHFYIIIRKFLRQANFLKRRDYFAHSLEMSNPNSVAQALVRASWQMVGALVTGSDHISKQEARERLEGARPSL